MRKYNWGIVGPGIVAREFANDLVTLKIAELYAVCSDSIERAKKFANEYNIPNQYEGIEAMCEDKNIDIAYIATINTRHKKEVIACLNAGINVLCEKPIAMNREELQEMISCAKENNVFLMEAVWTNFLPAIKIVKGWIEEGKIGEVKTITAAFGYHCEIKEGRLFENSLGGGAMLDLGPYSLGVPFGIVGKKPISVASSMYIGSTGVDETTNIIVSYSNGTCIRSFSSIDIQVPFDLNIIGTLGRIYVPEFFKAKKAELIIDEKIEKSFQDYSGLLGYAYEAQAVMECLEEGRKESEIMPLSLSLDIVEIMDFVRKSAGLKYEND